MTQRSTTHRARRIHRWLGRFMAVLLVAGAARPAQAKAQAARDEAGFLYVWATAVDTLADSTGRHASRGVFLATVDLRAASPTRGRVVGAVLADTAGRSAHHTEHALAADGILFANDFGSGRTHRFDLRTPGAPRLLGAFTTAGPYSHPHSFVRLAGGTVLATYQRQAGGGAPGALVELRRDGAAIRWARAATPGVDSATLLPYSLEVIPALDRVVTTSTSMVEDIGVHVQVWRLSDLALLHTLAIPAAPAHAGHAVAGVADSARHVETHHMLPGEPRLLADGRTVMLGTFSCGMYRVVGLDGATPAVEYVRAFPGMDCAVPALVGRWWVQTVPALRALVVLDVAGTPREAGRLTFPEGVTPHWLAADATGRRLVMNGGGARDPRLYLVSLDTASGALAHDPVTATVDLSRVTVPGLGVVRAAPHGAVFGPARP